MKTWWCTKRWPLLCAWANLEISASTDTRPICRILQACWCWKMLKWCQQWCQVILHETYETGSPSFYNVWLICPSGPGNLGWIIWHRFHSLRASRVSDRFHPNFSCWHFYIQLVTLVEVIAATSCGLSQQTINLYDKKYKKSVSPLEMDQALKVHVHFMYVHERLQTTKNSAPHPLCLSKAWRYILYHMSSFCALYTLLQAIPFYLQSSALFQSSHSGAVFFLVWQAP